MASSKSKVEAYPAEWISIPEVKIEIDETKCGPNGKIKPLECAKCMEVCPMAILVSVVEPMQKDVPFQPRTRRLRTHGPWRCMGEMDCVKVCPVGAIKITVAEPSNYFEAVRGFPYSDISRMAEATGYGKPPEKKQTVGLGG